MQRLLAALIIALLNGSLTTRIEHNWTPTMSSHHILSLVVYVLAYHNVSVSLVYSYDGMKLECNTQGGLGS